MPFDVFDYRTDVRNVVIMPDIRSRFLRMEPGEVGGRHSHDLGQEVFLILEGELIEDDGRVFRKGDIVWFRDGTEHSSYTPNGCLLAVHIMQTETVLE